MDNVPSKTNRVSPIHLIAQLLGLTVALFVLMWRSDAAVQFERSISAAPPSGLDYSSLNVTPGPPPCVTVSDSLDSNDPVQTGMIAQVGTPSECVWTPRPCPSVVDTQPRHYKIYTYYFQVGSFSTTCITVDLAPTGCPGNLYSVAYTWGSFNPNYICRSYAGDPGVVAAGDSQYIFQVFRGQYLYIVVHEVTPGTGCSQYTLSVSSSNGCNIIPTQSPTPGPSRTPTRTPTQTATTSPTPTLACLPAWHMVPSIDYGRTSRLIGVEALAPDNLWAVSLTVPYNAMRSLSMRYGPDPCDTPTPAPSHTSTPTFSVSSTPVATPSSTTIPPSITLTASPVPSGSPTPTSPSLLTETPAPSSPTPTPCALTFSDVPPGHTFYSNVRCLACRGIISGYADGTFRPNNDVTRGQTAKVVSNAAGFSEPVTGQTYEDVPPSQTFYEWIERLSGRGIMGGYPCGLRETEPCLPANRPYFRPGESATRGQVSKIVSNAAGIQDPVSGEFYTDVPEDNPFYPWIMRLTSRSVMSGYPCGGVNPQTGDPEPCDTENRPYFRWGNNVTRGQASKIVANTFFPDCFTP
jgi:hypothetical protein